MKQAAEFEPITGKIAAEPREPVFIVGSPRSGTSILTWCLGQHPNPLGLEESNWMMPFAVDVAVAFRRGSARDERSQFSSMGICRDRLMRDLGTCINESIVAHRVAFEERCTRHARPDSAETHAAFKIARDEFDPKVRWVNGTPEYSFGISGLLKLFPGARFIHLLRNCEDVVPSMVQFDRLAGIKRVANEQEGYELWLQFVRACVEAEEAYGPEVVCRLLHEDLVREPEKSIRRILDFIGEPYARAYLEPLVKRINSSRLTAEAIASDPPADPAVVHEACDLWNALREAPRPTAPSPEAAARLEEQFERRVDYIYELDTRYARAQQVHKKLEKEFAERTEWALRLDQEVAQKERASPPPAGRVVRSFKMGGEPGRRSRTQRHTHSRTPKGVRGADSVGTATSSRDRAKRCARSRLTLATANTVALRARRSLTPESRLIR